MTPITAQPSLPSRFIAHAYYLSNRFNRTTQKSTPTINHQQHFFWYFGTAFFLEEIFIVSSSFLTPSILGFYSTVFAAVAFDPDYGES